MHKGVAGGLYKGGFPSESGEGIGVVKRNRGAKPQGERTNTGNRRMIFLERFGELCKVGVRTD